MAALLDSVAGIYNTRVAASSKHRPSIASLSALQTKHDKLMQLVNQDKNREQHVIFGWSHN